MRKYMITALLCLGTCLCGMAQAEKNASSTLALKLLIEDLPEDFPEAAKMRLHSKVSGLMTQNGILSSDWLNRFFITVSAVPLTKDIVPGTPVRIAQNMEFTFYIADYVSQTVFSSLAVEAKGIGTSDTKCYLEAVSHIRVNTQRFKEFVDNGKAKIIDYYDQNADRLIAQAQSQAKRKEYEAALFQLIDVPMDCKSYDRYLQAADDIYQQYIDYECEINLAQARTQWMSAQNAEGAALAAEYLARIMPDAQCYDAATGLYNEIKGKVLDDWHFEMKKYQDGVDLESQRIAAMREVGVAFGEGQQPSTTNLSWLH